MNMQYLQDLHNSKRLYQASLRSSASWEYKEHCLEKLAVINKKIEDWYKEKEKKATAA